MWLFCKLCKVKTKTTEAKTKSKIISCSLGCQPASIKLQEIFIFSTVHSLYHHTEHHPYGPLSKYVTWPGEGSRRRKQQRITYKGGSAVKKFMSLTQIFLYIFSETLYFLSFIVSHECLILLQRATKRSHPKKSLPVYLKELYNICTNILYFHCFVNVGCLCIHKV